MEQSYWFILLMAFALGMLHALDADHIMAVTSMVSTKDGQDQSRRYSLRWSFGHSIVLLIGGIIVLFMGMAIPDELSHIAELLVGVVLILIGLGVIREIFLKRKHLHFHQHDNLMPHAHWHEHDKNLPGQPQLHKHDHKAVMIGMLHGFAGTAPVLALLPVVHLENPLLGMIYLLLFSFGIMISMLIFGGLLHKSILKIQCYGEKMLQTIRLIIGCSALIFGVVWIQVSW